MGICIPHTWKFLVISDEIPLVTTERSEERFQRHLRRSFKDPECYTVSPDFLLVMPFTTLHDFLCLWLMEFMLILLLSSTLDKTISNLEMELAAARAAQESLLNGAPLSEDPKMSEASSPKRKYLMVVGINTAFSSRKRRDSIRTTWMAQGIIWYLTFTLLLTPVVQRFY